MPAFVHPRSFIIIVLLYICFVSVFVTCFFCFCFCSVIVWCVDVLNKLAYPLSCNFLFPNLNSWFYFSNHNAFIWFCVFRTGVRTLCFNPSSHLVYAGTSAGYTQCWDLRYANLNLTWSFSLSFMGGNVIHWSESTLLRMSTKRI